MVHINAKGVRHGKKLNKMIKGIKSFFKRLSDRSLIRKYTRFRSTIYGRVVFIIAGSLIVLFILFNVVFRSIYVEFFNTTIR
ncbi:MAG TPA: hypothetical protein DEQ09_03490 [Bacteroidales bacterium]|nr:hypothetical protein [Bacteroidales bacterium]